MKRTLALLLIALVAIPSWGAVKDNLKPAADNAPAVQAAKAKTAVKKDSTRASVRNLHIITSEAVVSTPTIEVIAKKTVAFKDLDKKLPAYPYVMRMVVSYEAISGYPDNTFRGKKTVSRAEFSKVLLNTIAYFEKQYGITLADEPPTKEVKFKDLKAAHWAAPYVAELVAKYKLISGYPNGTFRPSNTISRFELATILAKTVRMTYDRYEMTLPTPEAVILKDVKSQHWAMRDIELMLQMKILDTFKEVGKKKTFNGNKEVSRYDVAVAGAKMIARINGEIAKLPAKKLDELRRKYGVKKAELPAPIPASRVERAVQVTSRPELSIFGGWGNINEGGSGTNNWMGFQAGATYGNIFKLWRLAGNYELTGRYGFNQVVYFVPSGGGVSGGTNNENRYEVEFNTIYPVVEFLGITGKLLLGVKYISLSNPTAPTNFTGFNAGVVTSTKLLGRKFLLRGFYSLPLSRAQVSPSILGQPAQLFDYEASIDAEIFRLPLLIGFSGETMTLSGGGARYYNNFFARYYLF